MRYPERVQEDDEQQKRKHVRRGTERTERGRTAAQPHRLGDGAAGHLAAGGTLYHVVAVDVVVVVAAGRRRPIDARFRLRHVPVPVLEQHVRDVRAADEAARADQLVRFRDVRRKSFEVFRAL